MVESEAQVGSDNEDHDDRVKAINRNHKSERESEVDIQEPRDEQFIDNENVDQNAEQLWEKF